ncbi:hypothetical protein [Helicobacter sp. T3_23-1056]
MTMFFCLWIATRGISHARNDDNVKSCNGNANSHNGIIFHSLTDSHTSCPSSFAEGARGWVDLSL